MLDSFFRSIRPALATALAGLLLACGGNDPGGIGSGGTGAAPSISLGSIRGFGSVIVNGVRFDESRAVIQDDDGEPFGIGRLRIGMVVEVRGSADRSAATGTATRIKVLADVFGPAQSVDAAANSLVAMGITVKPSAETVFEGVNSLAELQAGDMLEISGFLDRATGLLAATRIEKELPFVTGVTIKSKGVVGIVNPVSRTFTVSALTIDYSHAQLGNLGAGVTAPVAGSVVKVTGSRLPVGNVWQADAVQGVQAADTTGVAIGYVEGQISEYVSPSNFEIEGLKVNASAAIFANGTSVDLAGGVKVLAVGPLLAGILQASTVDIRQRDQRAGIEFEISGSITDFVSAANFKVRNTLIDASDPAVRYSHGTAATLANGRKVEIHGRIQGSVVKATEVSFDD